MRPLSGNYEEQRQLFYEAEERDLLRYEDQIREQAEKIAHHSANGPRVQIILPMRPWLAGMSKPASTTHFTGTIDVDIDPRIPPHGKKFIAENIIRSHLEEIGVI